jgi:hypothetical protein
MLQALNRVGSRAHPTGHTRVGTCAHAERVRDVSAKTRGLKSLGGPAPPTPAVTYWEGRR